MTAPVHKSLGRFVRSRERKDGTHEVFFAVPVRLRPEGWPPTIRLPQVQNARTRQQSATFWAEVQINAATLNYALDEQRRRERAIAARRDRNIEALAEIFYETKKFRVASKSRKDHHRYNIRRMMEWSVSLGDPDFVIFTKRDFEKFLALFEDRPFLQLDIRSTLHILCLEAVALGWRKDNPVADISWTAPDAEPVHVWSHEDEDRYFHKCVEMGQPALGVFIKIQAVVGQRTSDLLNCTYSKNLDTWGLHIRQSKTGEFVDIPLTKKQREMIEAIRVEGSDHLFNDFDTQGAFTYKVLRERFVEVRHALSQPGDPLLELRALRHTAVCRMIDAKLHLMQIAAVTGHAAVTLSAIMKKYAVDSARFANQAMLTMNRINGGSDDDFEGEMAGAGARRLNRSRKVYKAPIFDERRPGKYLNARYGLHRKAGYSREMVEAAHGWATPV